MQRKKKEATQAKAEDDLLAQKSEIAEQARKSAVAVRLLSLPPPHHLASHCIGLLRPTDDFVLLFAFIDLAAFSHRLMLFSQL